jgi:formylglycine-generating enzyme required for sulfatase activity
MGFGLNQRSARVESPSSDFLKVAPAPTTIQLEELLQPGDRPIPSNGLCPSDMASIDDRYCIDRFEGSLLEVLPSGDERSFDRNANVEGHAFRAVNGAGMIPQGYISANQAETACRRSGKRLCSPNEWRKACRGPDKSQYGYSSTNEKGRCNDHGKSPMMARFGLGGAPAQAYKWTVQKMNDPSLNQIEGTLAPSGAHPGCTNGYGVYDMVGNLHEWTNDPEGTFLGGYYLDIHQNGDGCDYRTGAHAVWYHDYSTGFRCCADPAQ